MNEDYHFSRKVNMNFDEAVKSTTEALQKEGFGIITTIDVKEVFKKKLDENFRNYTILGACNPRYAFEVLQEEDKIGVFLPCNVVVQEHLNGIVEVSAMNPDEMVRNSQNMLLKTYASEIRGALQHALDHL